MAKTDFKTVDEYIHTFPEDVQEALEKIRQTIKKAVPEAEEVISYQIPAFKYHGWILYISAYKNHYSISCPPPFTIFEVFKEELSSYELSKSTAQFPKSKPIPFDLIGKIAASGQKKTLKGEKVKKSKCMVTLNSVLDEIMKLDFTSREMLLEILEKRQIKARREQMIKDARKSVRDYRNGHVKSLSFEETVKQLGSTMRGIDPQCLLLNTSVI